MAWKIKRGNTYYLGWNDPYTKRDRYKSLSTDNEAIADLAVKKKEVELGERKADPMPEAPDAGGLTIDGLIARYIKDTKLSPETRRINAYSWKNFKELTGILRVALVKKETVIDFITKLEAKKYSETYISMCLRDMRKLWNYAIDEELATINYFKKVPLPENVEVARDVTKEDDRLIVECATPWLKRFIKVMRVTGLRPGQVASMDWQQINTRKMNLIVPKFKRQPERIMPIMPELLELLGPERHTGLVFLEFDGKTPTQARRKISREWRRAYNRAVKKGLKGRFRPYDLRHAKISELAEILNPYELTDHYGWSTVKMSDRYVHTRVETIREKLHKHKPPAP